MAVLLILSGKHQGKRLSIPEGEVVIGRDATCQVRLATEEVSRQHCRLRCEDDEVFVSDLSSRNGTLINDRAITMETPLLPGDILRVGPVMFQLVGQRSTVPERPAAKRPSDDSIMDWLSDESGSHTGDSTIIRKSKDLAKEHKPLPAAQISTTEIPPVTPPPPSKKFKTVGEEGEDVIQRHFDLVQAGKIPKRIPALRKS